MVASSKPQDRMPPAPTDIYNSPTTRRGSYWAIPLIQEPTLDASVLSISTARNYSYILPGLACVCQLSPTSTPSELTTTALATDSLSFDSFLIDHCVVVGSRHLARVTVHTTRPTCQMRYHSNSGRHPLPEPLCADTTFMNL